jgi:branched-chain amino acid transport system substrate-binding protein
MASGYGGDLELGGKEVQTTAQNVYFSFPYQPVELRTQATRNFQDALSSYAGVTGDPTLNEYIGYLAVDGFVLGMKAAGANPTQQSLIAAMSKVSDYGAAGLLGGHTISWVLGQRLNSTSECFWTTQYVGDTFHPVSNASPLCGTAVPGKAVGGK